MTRSPSAGRLRPLIAACALFVILLSAGVAGARDIYVATNGNNGSGDGSSGRPYQTIQKGIDVAQAGDRVRVQNGTYYEQVTFKRSGTSGAYIKLEAVNKHQAKVVADSRYTIFTNQKDYLEITNLDVKNTFYEWYDSSGIAIVDSHHVRVIGNRVHDCGGGGIEAKFSDSLVIEWNLVYNNTTTSIYQASGISIYQPQRLPGGGDWQTRIRYNKCWNNSHTVRNPNNNSISDGNGIIIDNTKGVDQTNDFGVPGTGNDYDRWVLVDSNMCWNNGGAGVSTYEATKVMIRNNSCRNNYRVLETGSAEITVGSSSAIRVINNALHGRGGQPLTKEYWSSDVQWSHNALHNGYNEGATLWSTLWQDPKFVSSSNLHIQSTSPCKRAGTTGWGTNDRDIDNQNRVQNGLDIGADEIN